MICFLKHGILFRKCPCSHSAKSYTTLDLMMALAQNIYLAYIVAYSSTLNKLQYRILFLHSVPLQHVWVTHIVSWLSDTLSVPVNYLSYTKTIFLWVIMDGLWNSLLCHSHPCPTRYDCLWDMIGDMNHNYPQSPRMPYITIAYKAYCYEYILQARVVNDLLSLAYQCNSMIRTPHESNYVQIPIALYTSTHSTPII